jgi:hypothetical protein
MGLGRVELPTSRLSGGHRGAWNPTPQRYFIDRPRDLPGLQAWGAVAFRDQSTPQSTPPSTRMRPPETAPGSAASVTPDAHPSSDAPTGSVRGNSGHARAGGSDRHWAPIGFGLRCFDPSLTRLRR